MRITGGTLRGRRLRMPPGTVRPTMDRMRESIFGMLGPLEGVRFLDLFGGSGAVALEAASRDAERVVTIERDRRNEKVLRENISLAKETVEVLFLPVERYVKRGSEAYDIIYVDP
ncbi:MAG: RsmD family RNA methyltransferase, partial [Spirochaetales bacterium]